MANFIGDSKLIFDSLREIGVCKCCCLRYLGERDVSAYREIEEWLEKVGFTKVTSLEKETKTSKPNPCSACLGLLQLSSSEDVAKRIAREVFKANYDSLNFTCAISLPISYQLRAHSIWLYLCDNFAVPFSLPEVSEGSHVTSVKDVWKWTIAPKVAKEINKILDSGLSSNFFVGINVIYPGEEEECSTLMKMHREEYARRRTQIKKYHGNMWTRKCVESTLQLTDPSHFKNCFPSPPGVPTTFVEYGTVSCKHNSVFIAGRYNKFSRFLSQTPWIIDGERRMDSSVQEIISEPIMKACKAEDGVKFLSSGREDVDVRMLGRGRPFAFELLNPHKVIFSEDEIRDIEKQINNTSQDVFVRDLQFVNKEELVDLKQGEESKTKIYTAMCVSRKQMTLEELNKLSELCPVTVQQKTPIRVLHRRPLSTRERIIYSMKAHLVPHSGTNKTLFKLELQTQAGTYVKEFIHGDFGRTKPYLGVLLKCEVDILALDVQEVILDWPKKIEYNSDSVNCTSEIKLQ